MDNITLVQKNYFIKFLTFLILFGTTVSISRIKRFWQDSRNISSYCSFLNYDNWSPAQCFLGVVSFILSQLAKIHTLLGRRLKVFLSVDLSLFKKPKQSHTFEGFNLLWDATTSSYVWAIPILTINATIGRLRFPLICRLTPAREVLRDLRRKYRKAEKTITDELYYESRSRHVCELLAQVLPLFPQEFFEVFLLFDRGFDSNRLLKFCFRHRLKVVCAIKKSRILNGVRLTKHFRTLGKKDFRQINLESPSAKGEKVFWVAQLMGKLKSLPGRYSVVISKNNSRDKEPKFLLCSDCRVGAEQILGWYQNRWSVEVDYLYVKEFLGGEDFRLSAFLAIYKYISLCFMALALLALRKWQQEQKDGKSYTSAQVLHQLRRQYTVRVFKEALRRIQQNYSFKTITDFLCVT